MSDDRRVDTSVTAVRKVKLRDVVTPTYGLVVSREAHVLVALWVGAVRLENKGESVAWRQQGLRARMMPVGRILIPTKLS